MPIRPSYTNKAGELLININDTELAKYHITDSDILTYTYKVTAKAVDATGESSEIDEQVDIDSRPVKIYINADKMLDRQALLPLNIKTTADFEGAVARPVAIKLYRVSNPDERGYTHRDVDQWYYNKNDWNLWFPNLAETKQQSPDEQTLVLDTVINTDIDPKLLFA